MDLSSKSLLVFIVAEQHGHEEAENVVNDSINSTVTEVRQPGTELTLLNPLGPSFFSCNVGWRTIVANT